MSKYIVSVPFMVWVNVEVEADSVAEAHDEGLNRAYLTGYTGNGGTNKLVGVAGQGMTIDYNGDPIDDMVDVTCTQED